jgi:hypothetical protein
MKPIGGRAASSTVFAGALLILSAVLAAGCATTGRLAPLDLPTAAAPSPRDNDFDRLTACYRSVDRRMNDLWEDEAQHALLHHL